MGVSREGHSDMKLSEADADPGLSAQLLGLPGWSDANSTDRSIVMFKALGMDDKKLAKYLGVNQKAIVSAVRRIDPSLRVVMKARDMTVFRMVMNMQLEMQAMRHITPKKLMMESALSLAKIAKMCGENVADMTELLALQDKDSPGDIPNDNPLERLRELKPSEFTVHDAKVKPVDAVDI